MVDSPDRVTLYLPDEFEEPARWQDAATLPLDFVDAFLTHGSRRELVTVVPRPSTAEFLKQFFLTHPAKLAASRTLRMIPRTSFEARFLQNDACDIVHFPAGLAPDLAWARKAARPAAFSLSGQVGTPSSREDLQHLIQLVNAPFESYDSLVCSSRSAMDTIRTLTDTIAAHGKHSRGAGPGLEIALVPIPPGVDTRRFQPATPQERSKARALLGVEKEDVVILEASLLMGGHSTPSVVDLEELAQVLGSPGRKILWQRPTPSRDARHPFEISPHLWHAADMVTSLCHPSRESSHLILLKGMACGLPVVAADWGGARELVTQGETGYLIPTYLVDTRQATSLAQFLSGAEDPRSHTDICHQSLSLDRQAVFTALRRLITDRAHASRIGQVAHRHVRTHFDWAGVVRRYESHWASQAAECRSRARSLQYTGQTSSPAALPWTSTIARRHPSAVLDASSLLAAETTSPRPLADDVVSSPGDPAVPPGLVERILEMAARPVPLGLIERAIVDHSAGQVEPSRLVARLLRRGQLRPIIRSDPRIIKLNMVKDGHLGGYIQGGDPRTWYPDLWRWFVTEHKVRSVLDVGCGEGRAARFFLELGCEVAGIEGCEQAITESAIPGKVSLHDFCHGPFKAPREFELVWSCEFVEHVDEEYVQAIIDTMAQASRFVLMTHAFPGQVGHHHVNLKPPSYWIELMSKAGMVLDQKLTRSAREQARKNKLDPNYFFNSGLVFRRPG